MEREVAVRIPAEEQGNNMNHDSYKVQRFRGIGFLGNYLPRACGIATFTHDLSNALAKQAGEDQPVIVAAMNDIPQGYAYPERVKFELRQDYQVDYSRAADFFNFSSIDVVSLQHEYGIFGGEFGSNVLTFLRDLSRRTVVTCHTVLEKPEPIVRDILREIASLSEKLVVMSDRAFGFLETAYNIPRNKIVHIPHGIHDVPFVDPSYYKDKFALEGQKVLLTFGLLNRNKGLEYMIEALPEIVKRHPKTTYVVLGRTHPAVLQLEGESYRLSLQRRIRELGMEQHVLFHPRFVDLDELLEYLGATDIFVTPYLHIEQITSGALAYAMGSGKAVVSTSYWHAEELLADDRGCLVPPGDSKALSQAINSLLDDEVKLNAMRKRAYIYCRSMAWSSVARKYLDLFEEVRTHVPSQFPTASAMRSPIAATNLPLPKIDHVLRLCDDTGPSRHARYAVPERKYGYPLDIAAPTLVACTKFHNIYNDERALKLTETCLTLFQTLIDSSENEPIAAALDYTRSKVGTASQYAIGKAIWALGYLVLKGPAHLVPTANDLFHQVVPAMDLDTPRAQSYAVLGACNYLKAFPGATAIKRFLATLMSSLEEHTSNSQWYQQWQNADWPVLAQAYCVAADYLGEDPLVAKSEKLIEHLREVTADGTIFIRGESDDSPGEQFPATCATFIEAMGAAFFNRRNPELLKPIRSAVDWFLGANQLNEPLYDFSTGGCHDSLISVGLNRNQGAEATVYCLLAFLSLNQIISLQDSSL